MSRAHHASRALAAPFACLLFLLQAASAADLDLSWLEIKSSNFRILSDGNVEEARSVALQFERIRAAFAKALPSLRLDSPVPLTILAVKDESSARGLLPEMWKRKTLKPGGFFAEGREKSFALIRLDVIRRQSDTQGSENGYQVVYHEYTHSLLNSNFRWLPLWLNEGLAEFLGNTQFQKNEIYLGAPNIRAEYTRGRPLLSLEKLLSVVPGSAEYEDADRVQVFYSESWGLVHLLLTSAVFERGKRLQQYLTLLDQGIDPLLAFRQTIGDFGKVEDQLKQYLDEQTHEVFVFDNPPEITAQSVSVRRLDPAEANAELGTAQVWLHENAAARQRLEKAIQIDGQSAVAREAIGMLSFNEGQDKQALAHFEEALRQDPNRYLAGYYRAMLSTGSSSALESVVNRNRDFAPAYIQLAISHIREGNIERALAPALKAAQLRPALGGYHVLVGNILHALGRDTEAATVARFVADRWEDVHHDEAVELWQKLPEQPQQGRVRSRRAPAAGTTVSMGRVASLACRDKDQTMALVIDNTPLTLRVKDEALKLSVSDTVWYGPDHFNRCLHLQGFRVLVVRRQNQLIELDVMSP